VEPLVDLDALLAAKTHLADWWNFLTACVTASVRLRWQSIERTVGSVAGRKVSRGAHRPLDIDEARRLTAIFHRLRPWFPTNHMCLFDSLALIQFLARYDIHPTWIFGVKLEPWQAHCWIQHDSFTFNERAEDVACYTPIMAI
jgi:hypothetical protein